MDGTFVALGSLGTYGTWWSKTQETGAAWYRDVSNSDGTAYRCGAGFEAGNSIRCVKD